MIVLTRSHSNVQWRTSSVAYSWTGSSCWVLCRPSSYEHPLTAGGDEIGASLAVKGFLTDQQAQCEHAHLVFLSIKHRPPPSLPPFPPPLLLLILPPAVCPEMRRSCPLACTGPCGKTPMSWDCIDFSTPWLGHNELRHPLQALIRSSFWTALQNKITPEQDGVPAPD